MNTVVTEAWRTIVPAAGDRHGPLSPILVGLTLVTGVVDAFSYLALGHVFVANMTGNVVFLAFGLLGAQGFSLLASLAALAAFSLGALAGGRLSAILERHRGHLVVVLSTVEALLLAIAVAIVSLAHSPGTGAVRYVLIVVVSLSMGAQNAVARKLAVPDLTTTVLTMTITGISADSRLAGGGGSRIGRRLVSALSMFLGALVSASLILKVNRVSALLVALGLLCIIVVATARASRSHPAWVHPPT
jgi:uncharacterized membrane protein YoaK (UPF0700 family)